VANRLAAGAVAVSGKQVVVAGLISQRTPQKALSHQIVVVGVAEIANCPPEQRARAVRLTDTEYRGSSHNIDSPQLGTYQ
jgi:hypothetical protein